MKKIILENLKTILYALVIAILIRSLLIQPFYIPSSSMEPSLLVGDRLFVSKLSYGSAFGSIAISTISSSPETWALGSPVLASLSAVG